MLESFKNYTEDVLRSSAFTQSENAQWLTSQRYLQNGDKCFSDVAARVARVLTAAESAHNPNNEHLVKVETNIYADMISGRFCFNSPCLFSAGAGLSKSDFLRASVSEMCYEKYAVLNSEMHTSAQQLFACFVINVKDSLDGIFSAVKDAAIISKFGGGVGTNFSSLRERNSPIRSGVGGMASGPVSFMEVWNTMGNVVVQGGRRRAALMGMLDIDHPDIEQFIECKTQEGVLSCFNISVAITDKFMHAVKEDLGFELISRATGKPVKTVRARELWTALCINAWKRGDPGIFFKDVANNDSLLKDYPDYVIHSTNPCGEQPLPDYTSCNLGSINLSVFVKDGVFDHEAFIEQIKRSMYYLDLVIDASSYPLQEIEMRTKAIRPVGLGIMGLADAAIKMNMPYGCQEFCDFCDKIASELGWVSLVASIELVTECHKRSFPAFDSLDITSSEIPSSIANALHAMPKEYLPEVTRALDLGYLRNSRRLSIAPTGSISMLLDTSAGVEPNFAWSWSRNIMNSDGEGYKTRHYLHPLVKSLADIRNNPVYKSAHDVSPEEHVMVTGIFAKYIDSGVSKTVNLPNSATIKDVMDVYQKCYDLGCKGITVYRDGSRDSQPIHADDKNKPSDDSNNTSTPSVTAVSETAPDNYSEGVSKRPAGVLNGKTVKDVTPWGSLFVTVNFDKGKPFETFATLGKSGSELKAMTEALSRVISIGIRSGAKLKDFISTLRGISGREAWMFDGDDENVIRSIPDAIAVLLERVLKSCHITKNSNAVMGQAKSDGIDIHEQSSSQPMCPECGSPMELVGGCAYCFSCGYSPCK